MSDLRSELQIRNFRGSDEPHVIALWREAGVTRPWNDPILDIERKRAVKDELFLVGEQRGALVATAMGGYDGHRGWVYYVAVSRAVRRRGHARALMAELERRLEGLGCPKLNLQVRLDNTAAIAFYERIGYKLDGVVALGKRLIPDVPSTPGEAVAAGTDVPSPIDLRRADHAATWAEEALQKRPQRTLLFAAFVEELARAKSGRVLELGSGPGFLAERLLAADPTLRLTLLDFSAAMHELAQARLATLSQQVEYKLASFLEPSWTSGLGAFDAVVTNQAVHELRHKSRASTLHAQVRSVLTQEGVYLLCDHYVGEDGMTNGDLYMTEDEQRNALRAAGFSRVERVLSLRGLVLHRAQP